MNLWKGEFIMRKNVKIIVGVVVLILVLVVGSFVGLIINRTNDHKFGRYVSTEGPWGMTATWVSEDSASYLVCKKENDEPFANVTAYFQGVDLIRQKSSLRSSHVFPVTGRVNGSDMAGGFMTVILRKCRKTVKKQFCAGKV